MNSEINLEYDYANVGEILNISRDYAQNIIADLMAITNYSFEEIEEIVADFYHTAEVIEIQHGKDGAPTENNIKEELILQTFEKLATAFYIMSFLPEFLSSYITQAEKAPVYVFPTNDSDYFIHLGDLTRFAQTWKPQEQDPDFLNGDFACDFKEHLKNISGDLVPYVHKELSWLCSVVKPGPRQKIETLMTNRIATALDAMQP